MKPQEQETAPREDGDENEDPSGNMGHDDQESDQDESESVTKNDFTDNEDINDESEEEMQVANPEPQGGGEVSITDEIFRGKEDSLLDIDKDGQQKVVVNQFTKPTLSKIRIPYKKLAEARKERVKRNLYAYDWNERRPEFQSFIKEARKNINYAVKEFEMRKAAFRYTRAQTAKTGSIDVNKLWSYKTNDDIFSRVTQLADAKNHGLIGMIDYSGSMHGTMGNVLDQVVHLGLFCRAVNIPFDIYGFTTNNKKPRKQIDGEMSTDNLSMPQILSSSLKKADFEEALYHCFVRREMNKPGWWHDDRHITGHSEEYGSTPLNQALNVSNTLIKEFKQKHGVDKMNFVLISDGDTNGSHPYIDYDRKDIKRTDAPRYYAGDVKFYQDGRCIEAKNARRGLTNALLQDMQKTHNTTTIGFFITNGAHEWKNIMARVYTEVNNDDDTWTEEYREFYTDANKEYRKNKCFTTKGMKGYNEYYVIKSGRNLETKEEEFNVDHNATKGQITAAFKKHSKSKKYNKVLLTNFGRAVA